MEAIIPTFQPRAKLVYLPITQCHNYSHSDFLVRCLPETLVNRFKNRRLLVKKKAVSKHLQKQEACLDMVLDRHGTW